MPLRVLVVDDSHATRAFVGEALVSAGDFEVTEADCGLAALRALPQGDFDLVITDINMPDLHGLELIRFTRAQARYKATPLLVISTEGRDRDRQQALALGADEYLVKPLSVDGLLEAVRRHLPDAAP